MGCVSSRAEADGVVARCRERRRLMKQAVAFRHQFAAAHIAYVNSLKNTGSALSQFANGEPMVIPCNEPVSVSCETPTLQRTVSSSTLRSDFLNAPQAPPPVDSSPSGSPSASSIGNRTRDDPWGAYNCSTPTASTTSGWPYYASSSPRFHGQEPKKVRREDERFGDFAAGNVFAHHFNDDQSRDRFSSKNDGHDYCSSVTSSEDLEIMDEDLEINSMCKSSRGGGAGAAAAAKECKDADGGSVCSWYTKGSELIQVTLAKRHKDFGDLATDIDGYFVKACEAGMQVSAFLETSRSRTEFQTKRSFYHSPSLFSSLSWKWSSKPPLAIKYSFEPSKNGSSTNSQSHCSTLERILAWEKKLYEEVKENEARKNELEKKLELLRSQELKGENGSKIEKTNASIKRLQSLIMVTSEAVNRISATIAELRERELWPQLQELAEGSMLMWRTINDCHQIQNHIVQQVKNLESSGNRDATSDTHRQATLQLEMEITRWYNSFCGLIRYQREYIRALQQWIRLSIRHVGPEPKNEHKDYSPIFPLCEEWQQALEKLPDQGTSETIKNFISVVKVIVGRQADEQKQKKKTESLSKTLQKKMLALSNIEKKYYSSYSLPSRRESASGDGHWDMDISDPLAEKRAEIETCKRLVEDQEANYSRSIQVTKDVTLNNIQTALPGLFQAISGFSEICVRSFEDIYNRSRILNEQYSKK